ncbi:MAG: sulfotransferase, partial [Kiloniellaceae bacterium]
MTERETATASEVKPIFLFGMERSGTTLLSMMVGAHPQIAVPLATTGMWIDFG